MGMLASGYRASEVDRAPVAGKRLHSRDSKHFILIQIVKTAVLESIDEDL